jgi:predicted nucleic acid-binding protein
VGTLIDTSVLIPVERGELDLRDVADADERLAIAAITASELLFGLHSTKDIVRRTRIERSVERMIGALDVIPFSLDVARLHAQLSADLEARGSRVGAHDLMIAATAIWLDYRIATRDIRSFPRIKGLAVVRW